MVTASYPNSIIAFTTKTNKVDLVDADHINQLQAEVAAIETELGKLVKESTTNLKTRLLVAIGVDGALQKGTSFPSTPTPIDGQPFWRTDTDILNMYNGSAWNPAVPGPSNLFSAYNSADQTAQNDVDVSLDTEDFDTGSNFASSTFTAPATGKYIFNAVVSITKTTTTGTLTFTIRKNGSTFMNLGKQSSVVSGLSISFSGSVIMDLTATDTITLHLITTAGDFTIEHSATETRFTGCRLA